MWMYLLKFSACLIILLLFYKLVLEKVHIHHFKRYFLLAAFIIALGIPLITFTHYVTVVAKPFAQPLVMEPNFFHQVATADNTSVVPIILWSIYGLGVVAFTIKFLLNLKSIISSIRNNPKQRSGKLLHVLLQENIAPYTFFNHLFFNIKNYKTHKIPKEVFWHEETHAKQKHSLDILLLELLQIIFWFHPLIYWVKHLVKLNHEFLADQAVLNKGAAVPAYQNLVLAFSSSDSYRNAIVPPLANAIHYSSIKKRIVIMKTQTTKKAIWLKSLLLLPLLALLLYGFSTKEIHEIKKVEKETILPDHLNEKSTGPEIIYNIRNQDNKEHEILISINKYGQLLINDNLVKIEDLKSHLLHYNQNITKEQRSKLIKSIIQVDKETQDKLINKVEAILMDYGVATIDIKENIKHQKQKGATHNKINILINRYGQLLVNDNLVKIEDLKSHLLHYNQNITREQRSKLVKSIIQVDKETPDKLIKKVEAILMDYGVATIDIEVNNKHQHQNEATKAEIKEYDILAKKYNAQPRNERGINGKDLERLEDIYKRMSNTQKNNVQPFPNFSPQPPVPAPKAMKNSKLPPPIPPTATKKEGKKHKSTIQAYEKGNPGIIKTKKTADNEIIQVIEIVDDQKNVPPPPPPYKIPDQEKHSKALLDAFKNFDEKANTYGKAVDAYMKKKEGTLSNLEALYEETMVLYDSYVVLAIKEDLMKPTRSKSAAKKEDQKIEPQKTNSKDIETKKKEQDKKVEFINPFDFGEKVTDFKILTNPAPIYAEKYLNDKRHQRAEIYFNGMKIDHDKAIKLLKSNKALITDIWKMDDKKVIKLASLSQNP